MQDTIQIWYREKVLLSNQRTLATILHNTTFSAAAARRGIDPGRRRVSLPRIYPPREPPPLDAEKVFYDMVHAIPLRVNAVGLGLLVFQVPLKPVPVDAPAAIMSL